MRLRTRRKADAHTAALAAALDFLLLARAHAAAPMTATGRSYEGYLADLAAYPLDEVLPRAKWAPIPAASPPGSCSPSTWPSPAHARALAAQIALLSPAGVPASILFAPDEAAGFRDASAALATAALITHAGGELLVMHRLTARVICDHALASGILHETAATAVSRVSEALTAHA